MDLQTTFNEESFSLDKERMLNKEDSERFIQKAYSEVNKEISTLKIKSAQAEKVTAEIQKLKNYLKDFKNGVQLILDAGKTNTQLKSKRSTKLEAAPLSQNQRIAFKKFYESFDTLNSEGKKYFSDLIKTSEMTISKIPLYTLKHNSRDISRQLQRINWEGKSVEFKFKNLKGKKNSSDGNYGWGNWSSNPFSYFYEDEKTWREAVSTNDEAEAAFESYMARMRFPCLGSTLLGAKMVEHCYSSKSWYESQLNNSRSSVEYHISRWMISQMKYSL
ncbi:hypothetical protein [Candidatus Mycoplasma haematominutum]|nr:hypothetical protein [Candidatus Mycoplasma haematominutum]